MSVLSGAPTAAPMAPSHPARRRLIAGIIIAFVVALAIALWGGYVRDWEWTGVNEKETLWHWLQLLMVPIAFATLPLVLRRHAKMRPERKAMLAVLLVAFIVFVIVGYAVPLDWTGFGDQALWDWLTLLLLPAAIISVRFIHEESHFGPPHYITGAAIVLAFIIIVIGGYAGPWDWTGFEGNTLLDWIQLLFVPLIFPTLVVPAVAAWFTAARRERAEERAARAAAS